MSTSTQLNKNTSPPNAVVNISEIQKSVTDCTNTAAIQLQLIEKINRIASDITTIKSDFDKIKTQLNDKVSKIMLQEIESKIINHAKILDTTSKKMNDLQNNIATFVNQPISEKMMEELRKQLTCEIMNNITTMLDEHNKSTEILIEKKLQSLHQQLSNTKHLLFNKK